MKSLFLLLVLSATTTPLAAHADTLTLTPTRDNTLYQTAPDADPISNGAGAYLFVGFNSQAEERRAAVRFDLSQVPPGSTIQSAVFSAHISRTNAGSATIALHRLIADWGEAASDAGEPGGSGAPPAPGDATWLDRFYPSLPWTAPGGDFEPAPSTSALTEGLTTFTCPSTNQAISDAQSWLDHPETNFGWLLLSSGGARRLDARENPDPAHRPTLTLTYTPPCPADFNHSGAVSIQDIFDYLSAYFASSPAADINHSGAVTVQDIFDFLSAYFTGC